uniref:NADH-ubiquinone oxidoreductase chain 6 n=1 Tax=Lioporeus pilatei TaxID=2714623 RepID=A0A894JVK6_9DYTI|nr:NADH dehydrogenase subunit 6 [Lioporeus pilatei]QRV62761.1 NADH dehydrogenase subunit 6 [Lioporeus pilatei]
MFISIIMNFMMTMIFMFLNHPMSMGLILLIQTILISLIMGPYSYSMWFSYILFLIMVGGMLILFMYMTSLASNEKFKFSSTLLTMTLTIIFISLMLIMFTDKSMINLFFKNSNLMESNNIFSFLKNENLYSLNMMYNKPNNLITIILINYLFLTLIAIVKITKSNIGPLRQKF